VTGLDSLSTGIFGSGSRFLLCSKGWVRCKTSVSNIQHEFTHKYSFKWGERDSAPLKIRKNKKIMIITEIIIASVTPTVMHEGQNSK